MYKMSRLVCRANDNSRYFLTLKAAEASGMRYTVEYIPVYEKYPISEKKKALRRKMY